MRTKCLPLYLDPETYRRLEEHARAEERDALQQARWLIRQAMETPPEPAATPHAPETAGTAGE